MKTTRHCSLMLLMMLIAALTMLPMAITGSTAAADERDEAQARDKAAGATVTLIEAGAEPRRALRLTANPGDTQRIVLSQRMQMEQMMNGTRMPSMPMPVTEFHLAIKVDRVDDDGTIHYTGTYEKLSVKDEPGVDPNMRRMMEQSMQAIFGVTVTVAMTERGFIQSFELGADQVRDPMMQQILQGLWGAFEQSSMPLPEDPVGVGAKWKTESTSTAQGMTMDMVSNITLEEFAESGFDLSVELILRAEEQPLTNAPAGMKMTLKSMNGSGEGRHAYRDARLMPLGTMKTSTETDIEVEMEFANQRQRMTQTMQIEQQFREVGAEPDADKETDE